MIIENVMTIYFNKLPYCSMKLREKKFNFLMKQLEILKILQNTKKKFTSQFLIITRFLVENCLQIKKKLI